MASPAHEPLLWPVWPTTQPDADTLTRYFISIGQFTIGQLEAFGDAGVFRMPVTSPLHLLYIGRLSVLQHAHDAVLALKTVSDENRNLADDLAAQIWGAADAGDSYGDWIWEWATDAGLDPEAIRAQGKLAGQQSVSTLTPADG